MKAVGVSSEVLDRWIDQIRYHEQDLITIDDRDLLSALEELKQFRGLFTGQGSLPASGVEL